jgi:hypothetical protein
MTFLRKAVVLALLTLTLAAGSCRSGHSVLIQPVPALDPALAQLCSDPGVAHDAVVALVQNRQAWAECAARHAAVVEAWPG